MGITFTRKGYIQVLKDGVVLSSHIQEREAIESLSEREDGDYVIRYPDVAVSVILRKSDTTPPAVPSGFSASAATATSVTLTLTANVESDFSNYVLERSSDNVGWGYLKSFTGTSTTDTVDVSGSTYYYRAFSIDTRGNRSAYTAVKSAGPYTVAFSWNGTVPNVTFTRGNAQNFDLSPYIIGSSPTITVETGTLPSGVTLNSSLQRLQYDGTSATSTSIVSTGISLRLSTSAAADWNSRISGSNVVWYHNFESAAEVNQFRWASAAGGNDPTSTAPDSSYVSYDATDGVGGGCLKWRHPAGSYEPDAAWWRPFFPISGAQNGRGVDDPAANGSLTIRNWTPGSDDNMLVNSPYGYYGNSTYHAAHPGQFDGTEYWLQFRVKVDLARAQTVVSGGKFWYQTTNFQSLTAQEIVTYPDVRSVGGQIVLRVNRSGGTPADQDPPGDTINGQQVNSEYGYCDVVTSPGGCWAFTGGWDVLMYHVRPGTHSGNDTLLEIWAAPSTNPTVPVRIWNQSVMDLPFDTSTNRPKGINAFLTVPYGQATYNAEYGLKFCQMIFSKASIPWPTV